jgi:excisionase family DNA binding protein
MGEPEQTNQTSYQHDEAVDVEGIEIFCTGSQFGNSPVTSQQHHINLPTGLSIKDAAKVLGVSTNTIRSRIRTGELAAEKVKGPTSDKWLVFLNNLPTSSQQLTSNVPEVMQAPVNKEIQRLLDIVEAQTAKLEAASMQIGYYKAQWEVSQEQIKLLTDSQHKIGFWHKAARWFFGERVR